MASEGRQNTGFSEEKACQLLSTFFNLTPSSLKSLPSYEDQNFFVKSTNGLLFVLKIYSSGISLQRLGLENEVLGLLQKSGVLVPRVVPNVNKEGVSLVEEKGQTFYVRLLTFVEGKMLAQTTLTRDLVEDVGRTLGKLDVALLGFEGKTQEVETKWDLKNALWAREYIGYLKSSEDQQIAQAYLNDFEEEFGVVISLRKSLIHHDANEYNVVVSEDGSKVAGIIDFGDMLTTFTVCELAIGCAYCMICVPEDQIMEMAMASVRGYNKILPLTMDELRVLFTLICCRLVISVTSSSYAMTLDPTNEYIPISQKPALRTLRYLHKNVTREQAFRMFASACGISVENSGMRKDELLQIRYQNFGKSLSISYSTNPLKIVRGYKQFLFDETGQKYLDGVNNVAHVGHCHEEITRAVTKQIGILNTNTRYLGEELARYIKALLATFPKPLSVCFLTCSGSEANDLALRLARTYTKKKDVVVLDAAYHGNLTSLVEMSPYKFKGKGGFPCPPHVHVAEVPDTYRGPYKKDEPQAGEKYAQSVLEKVKECSNGIAAFFCESVPGCAGQIVLPPGYLKHVYAHVRQHGGLCVADEVQVGFGRVGTHFWAFETQGVVPDIVTMGKPIGNGYPMGAVVTTAEIADAFANGMEYFNTFGGSNLACVVGLKVLEIVHKEGLQSKSRKLGEMMGRELTKLKEKHPLIGDVRGLGLFYGVELVRGPDLTPAAEEASKVILILREKYRVLISTDGPFHNVLKIKPPLCWTEEDVSTLVLSLDNALTEIEKKEK